MYDLWKWYEPGHLHRVHHQKVEIANGQSCTLLSHLPPWEVSHLHRVHHPKLEIASGQSYTLHSHLPPWEVNISIYLYDNNVFQIHIYRICKHRKTSGKTTLSPWWSKVRLLLAVSLRMGILVNVIQNMKTIHLCWTISRLWIED